MSITDTLLTKIKLREGVAPEFIQAVTEVLTTLGPVLEKNPDYVKCFEALVEPERVVMFRVPWEDDHGKMQVNRGMRVQYSSVLGPYKGGLRFHPSVNLSVIKFLGFEQCFKNALTGLPMGGGKGGSDFDPKGKSDNEVRRFCQSFMLELQRHIGGDTDVPAGDIGVGGREIGFLFGQYKRIRNETVGVLTGKSPKWGGSLIRPEATGYGTVYFADALMRSKGQSLKGKKCLVSGSGNVSTFCIEKLLDLGAKPVTASDSSGTIYDPEGFTREKLAALRDLKEVKRGRISELVDTLKKLGSSNATFHAGKRPWELGLQADAAFPCATQNEIGIEHAPMLVKSGIKFIAEGANMPTSNEAIGVLTKGGVICCPGKASNAGGVAVSGLEMSQNSMRLSWTRKEVDEKLHAIMNNIFNTCKEYGKTYGTGDDDLITGANVASFITLASGMMDLGFSH